MVHLYCDQPIQLKIEKRYFGTEREFLGQNPTSQDTTQLVEGQIQYIFPRSSHEISGFPGPGKNTKQRVQVVLEKTTLNETQITAGLMIPKD